VQAVECGAGRHRADSLHSGARTDWPGPALRCVAPRAALSVCPKALCRRVARDGAELSPAVNPDLPERGRNHQFGNPKPYYVQGLNLGAVNAEADRRGFVPVDEQMQYVL